MRDTGMTDEEGYAAQGVDVTPQKNGPDIASITIPMGNGVSDQTFHANVRLSGNLESMQIVDMPQTSENGGLHPLIRRTHIGATFHRYGRRETVKATYYWIGDVALIDESTVRTPSRVWQ